MVNFSRQREGAALHFRLEPAALPLPDNRNPTARQPSRIRAHLATGEPAATFISAQLRGHLPRQLQGADRSEPPALLATAPIESEHEAQLHRMAACQVHQSTAAASTVTSADLAAALEQSYQRSFSPYGTAPRANGQLHIPPDLRATLEAVQCASEQCAARLATLERYDPALQQRGVHVVITPEHVAEAASVSREIEQIAAQAVGRLCKLVNRARLESNLAALGPASSRGQDAAADRLDLDTFERDMATLKEPFFQRWLASQKPLAQRLRDGAHEFAERVRHAPQTATNWLIPTLQHTDPVAHRERQRSLMDVAAELAAIDKGARDNLACIEIYLPSIVAPGESTRAPTAQEIALHRRAQSDRAAIDTHTRFATEVLTRGPRRWFDKAHADKEIGQVHRAHEQALLAAKDLELLLLQARTQQYRTH